MQFNYNGGHGGRQYLSRPDSYSFQRKDYLKTTAKIDHLYLVVKQATSITW